MRIWLATLLLAGSWLFGVQYYRPPWEPGWGAMVLAGLGLLYGRGPRWTCVRTAYVALLLLVPPILVASWPLRAVPLSFFLGILLQIVPIPRAWPSLVGRGLCTGGLILGAQAIGIFLYRCGTARSHELPGILADVPSAVAKLVGIAAADAGDATALYTIRKVHLLGPTWGLLFDPVMLGILCGGIVLLLLHGLRHRTEGPLERKAARLGAGRAV